MTVPIRASTLAIGMLGISAVLYAGTPARGENTRKVHDRKAGTSSSDPRSFAESLKSLLPCGVSIGGKRDWGSSPYTNETTVSYLPYWIAIGKEADPYVIVPARRGSEDGVFLYLPDRVLFYPMPKTPVRTELGRNTFFVSLARPDKRVVVALVCGLSLTGDNSDSFCSQTTPDDKYVRVVGKESTLYSDLEPLGARLAEGLDPEHENILAGISAQHVGQLIEAKRRAMEALRDLPDLINQVEKQFERKIQAAEQNYMSAKEAAWRGALQKVRVCEKSANPKVSRAAAKLGKYIQHHMRGDGSQARMP